MPNSPAKDGATIPLRLPQATKDAIKAEVDRLNTESPGAAYTMSSWIRVAIDNELARSKKLVKKNKLTI